MAGGRVFMVSWDGGGNFPPALALAARLVEAGRQVTVMADGPSADRVAACGAKFLEFSSSWPDGFTFEEDLALFHEVRNGVRSAEDVLRAARDLEPDVMVVDCMAGAGLVAAEVLGLPTAVLVHVLYQPFVSYWADLSVDVSGCRQALGLAPLGTPAMAEQLSRAAKVLVLVPEEFDYPDAPLADGTHYVGPIFHPRLPDRPADLGFDPSDDRPLVLASLSTTPQRQQEALPAILNALGRLPVRGLLTLGGVDVGALSPPANVVVHDYLPHGGVLDQVSAVISHGGLSTIMAALAHGVPLVCVPQGREQPLNADRVQACGAGINLPMDVEPSAMAEAVSLVLDQPQYRNAARFMATHIQGQGGGASALRHVEALLERP
jgi:UDP:flavonoid glycosyltransferase YjiC (YdhE family)